MQEENILISWHSHMQSDLQGPVCYSCLAIARLYLFCASVHSVFFLARHSVCSFFTVVKRLIYLISLAIRQSFFSLQNNPESLDPSFKMDLDLWDCLGRAKLVL